MAQLVVTVTGRTMAELRRARDAAAAHADVIELRLDGVDRPDIAGALDGRLRPVIVTCRPRWEGGQFDGSEQERQQLLVAAAHADAEFVDVEFRAEFAGDLVRTRRGRGVIVSMHLLNPAENDYPNRLAALRAAGAEVTKLAVQVDSLAQTLPLFELGQRSAHDAGAPHHVLIAMGPRGVHTRVLSERLNNRWAYSGDALAPGQLSPKRMLSEYQFRRVRADADLYGVVGSPVAHSLSPAMHNAGFAECSLNAVYVPLDARDVGDFVAVARALNLRGASITAPFKVDMFTLVDDRDRLADEVGAINTLVVKNGRWTGTNTDVAGFLAPLKGKMKLRGTRAAVLGGGGAARAVAVALKREGAAVTICARRRDQAKQVAKLAGVRAGAFPPQPGTWDVLVNATSCGSRPDDDSPMAGVPLDGEIVFDLIYSPPDTPLITQARNAGCLTIGGIEMLIAQAERQFESWTGALPPSGLFTTAVAAAAEARAGVRS
jgi:3-dehydroquinate dehydratase / shikimate dehydrogenase